MEGSAERVSVSFDVGGTFTDVAVLSPSGLATYKIPSQEDARELGRDVVRLTRDSLARDGGSLAASDIWRVAHGTTMASNTVIEGRGPVLAVLTTQGFRDELEVRRLTRPGIWDPLWQRTPALVPRRLRWEIPERTAANGLVEHRPDPDVVRAVFDEMVAAGVDALAICFVNAYVNGENERAVLRMCEELRPGICVSISSDVLPEAREYERMSTTALNVYLRPVLERHIGDLEGAFEEITAPVSLMQSNGGLTTAAEAKARPISLIESGPAAGAVGAATLAVELGEKRCVAFDMGGTTAKVCLIEGGLPAERSEMAVSRGRTATAAGVGQDGYALRVAAFEIVEIGAGGGSIAWLDEGGALHVGPRSAGATPGPACYGNGGTMPTVTDANVFLGRISPTAIAGGEVDISLAMAEEVLSRLASECQISTQDLALGIVAIANASMARAIRAVTTERGKDPRDFSLMAFGGAGPLHACELAERLGMSRVIVPPYSGVFSALGMLVADMRHDFVRSVSIDVGQGDGVAAVREHLEVLEQEATASVKTLYGRDTTVQLIRRADVRYSTQQAPLSVAFDPSSAFEAADLRRAFEADHLARYGYVRVSDSIKVDALRVRVSIASAEPVTIGELGRSVLDGGPPGPRSERRVQFHGGDVECCPILSRLDIAAAPASGPLVVEERDSTILVPEGWHGRCDDKGNLHLHRVQESCAS